MPSCILWQCISTKNVNKFGCLLFICVKKHVFFLFVALVVKGNDKFAITSRTVSSIIIHLPFYGISPILGFYTVLLIN
jgi:hypothetical protein